MSVMSNRHTFVKEGLAVSVLLMLHRWQADEPGLDSILFAARSCCMIPILRDAGG